MYNKITASAFGRINNRISWYLILLLSLVIPVNDRIVVFVIALIFLNWLIGLKFLHLFRKKRNIQNISVLLPVFLFLAYLLGMIYTKNGPDGWFVVEVKTSLLIFPLLFLTLNKEYFRKEKINTILVAFVAGCFLASLTLIVRSYIDFLGNADINSFYYGRFARLYHPSYISMYYTFSIGVLLFLLTELRRKLPIGLQVISVFLILYFVTVIFLASSRAGVLGLGTILLAYLFYLVIRKSGITKIISVLVLFVIMFFISFQVFTYTTNRFISTGDSLSEVNGDQPSTSSSRIHLWKSSLEVLEHHFLIGVGSGDVRELLLDSYKASNFQAALHSRLNAHNQYLETFIALGLPGFFLLLSVFLVNGYHAIRKSDMLLIFFLLLTGLHFSFESMLERQAGVVFFAFFISFLVTRKNNSGLNMGNKPEL